MNQKTAVPSDCNVIILCHSDKKNGRRESGSGPIEPLLTFFTQRKARYIFVIEQPHPLPDIPLDCTMEVYKDGKRVATHRSDRFRWLYNIPSDRRVMKTYQTARHPCVAPASLTDTQAVSRLRPHPFPDRHGVDQYADRTELPQGARHP